MTVRPLIEVMQFAARNDWFAKTRVSTRQLREIAQFGCVANDALAAIRMAAERARDQGGALDPASLLAFLADNDLILTETIHGQAEPTESEAHQLAGAANA